MALNLMWNTDTVKNSYCSKLPEGIFTEKTHLKDGQITGLDK